MKKFIASNQKGGVGKTILSYNLAHYLAEGARVLAIDFDEQGNASSSLEPYALSGLASSALFGNARLRLPAQRANLVLLRADDAGLKAVERSPLSDADLVGTLRARLAELASDFDYAVFDTPGANSRIANAALVASDVVLVPCKIDQYSIDVAGIMLTRIAAIQATWNPQLLSLGILANEYDARQPAQVADLKKLLGTYPDYMFRAFVSDRSAYREASSDAVPVWKLKKTAARDAGVEIRAVFKMMLDQVEAA